MSYLVVETKYPYPEPEYDRIESRFINELYEQVKLVLAKITDREVRGIISKEIDPEFGEPHIKITIYVDLDQEEYLSRYYDLRQRVSKILIELYHKFVMMPMIFSETFFITFDTPATIRRVLDDLLDRLLIDILPMR